MASVIDRRGVEKARRNLFEWIYGYVVENVRAAAMVLGIVLVLTLIAGKIPVFSVLLEKEHEIMYAGQFDNCKRMKQFIRKDALLFRLKVANTGQNPADEVRVVIEDIPYPVDQAFCVIQNVSADRERLYDPEVYAICENDWKTECPRMKPKLQLMATCDELYAARQVLIAESEEAGESDERHAADYSMFYADPCPEEDGSPGRIRKRFRIERMAPGTLVFIGFTSFEDEGSDYDWKALENIRVTVEADCEVVAGDPQATALARIYKSILEFF